MILNAEYAREWFGCAYDLLDTRMHGVAGKLARDAVWTISDGIADDATPEECTVAHSAVLDIVRSEYITAAIVADAAMTLYRVYVADELAEELDIHTPADAIAYARDVLTLPGDRAVGGYPIDWYNGTDFSERAAFIVAVAASADTVTEALSI